MKLLKSWKHAGARLRSFTWMTSYDSGNRDPRKDSRVCCCFIASTCDQLKALQETTRHSVNTVHCNDCAHQCFSTFLQQNLLQMFALFMELYAMIQVSILLQLHRTVVANFVLGNFGLFWRIPWKSLAEPWGSAEPQLKNTDAHCRKDWWWKAKPLKRASYRWICSFCLSTVARSSSFFPPNLNIAS